MAPARDSDLTRRFRVAAAADKSTTAEPEPAAPSGFVPGFTPGKAGPVGDDPRHDRAYPHPENPGLFTDEDGFYDWADRRLFLADGSPDPMTPGAYRYQTRPDLCDLDASDTDPSSPRYEPDHLRHRPGDTWVVDGRRPYDALDPGPFGSPGWFPDLRTGRHRRDELPDPIPPWEIEEDPEKAAWAEQAEALWERRTRVTREREAREVRERRSLEAREVVHAERSRAEEPKPPGRSDPPGGSGSAPSQSRSRSYPQGGIQGRAPDRAEPVRRPAPGPAPEAPYRFSKLREDAWDQFLLKSAPLAAAHQQAAAGPGRMGRIVRRVAGVVRRTRRRRPGPAPEPRPVGPRPPRQRTGPRPVDHTAIARRTSRMASAFRGAERARTELAARRSVPDPKVGSAAWA